MKTLRKKLNTRHKNYNAMIIVERTKKRIFRYLPLRYIPSDSMERNYNGNNIHILGLDLKGQLFPIIPKRHKNGLMPTDLYMAMNCADEVEEVYGISVPTIERVKIGLLVGLCIAIMIVIFLTATAAGGA